MSSSSPSLTPRVAVIGAGMAGAACAASLHRTGLQVTLYDKSRGVGGRMATRRATLVAGDASVTFDHGAQHIHARQPRFKAMLARATVAGVVMPWQPRVHGAWPAPTQRLSWLPLADMPSLCRHLAADVPQRLGHQVQRLQRAVDGWQVVSVDGQGNLHTDGPFEQVLLAMPPAQAATLLAGHHERWADALAAVPMLPCWTLMAVTADVDWPWDAAEPTRGPLAWVARNDRKPGREALPGRASWVAHASAAWSAEHLEDSPESVTTALGRALATLLPNGVAPKWQHRAVHRWRYAAAAGAAPIGEASDCWWDARRGLGVCGDFLGAAAGLGGVEAAWRSGDELADTLIAALDATLDVTLGPAAQPGPIEDEVALAA